MTRRKRKLISPVTLALFALNASASFTNQPSMIFEQDNCRGIYIPSNPSQSDWNEQLDSGLLTLEDCQKQAALYQMIEAAKAPINTNPTPMDIIQMEANRQRNLQQQLKAELKAEIKNELRAELRDELEAEKNEADQNSESDFARTIGIGAKITNTEGISFLVRGYYNELFGQELSFMHTEDPDFEQKNTRIGTVLLLNAATHQYMRRGRDRTLRFNLTFGTLMETNSITVPEYFPADPTNPNSNIEVRDRTDRMLTLHNHPGLSIHWGNYAMFSFDIAYNFTHTTLFNGEGFQKDNYGLKLGFGVTAEIAPKKLINKIQNRRERRRSRRNE